MVTIDKQQVIIQMGEKYYLWLKSRCSSQLPTVEIRAAPVVATLYVNIILADILLEFLRCYGSIFSSILAIT